MDGNKIRTKGLFKVQLVRDMMGTEELLFTLI